MFAIISGHVDTVASQQLSFAGTTGYNQLA